MQTNHDADHCVTSLLLPSKTRLLQRTPSCCELCCGIPIYPFLVPVSQLYSLSEQLKQVNVLFTLPYSYRAFLDCGLLGGGGVSTCYSFAFKVRRLKFCTELLWSRIRILQHHLCSDEYRKLLKAAYF